MPIINGPYHDPEETEPPRHRRPPKALLRLQRKITHEKRLTAFREVFKREPASDEELDAFADNYIRELYNSGLDERIK